MKRLVLCGACRRHVRAEEQHCPFCGTPCRHEPAPVPTRLRGRPGGRAALFLAGVAGATSAVGCNRQEEEDMATPVYGIPVDAGLADAGADADDGGSDGAASNDDAMAAPVYGVPVDGGAEDDGGQAAPVYGVPIDGGDETNDPADAGDAEIMVVPIYGLALDDDPE